MVSNRREEKKAETKTLSEIRSGEEFWNEFDLERFFKDTDRVGDIMREDEKTEVEYERG